MTADDEKPTLQQQCDSFTDNFVAGASEEVLILMKQFAEDIKQTRIADLAVQAPQTAPDFVLPDQNGKLVSLKKLRSKGPVILSFYRGSWCPYCNMELDALKARAEEIEAKGATLVAISPMLPELSRTLAETKGLGFPVLTDKKNLVAKKYKLVFKIDEALHFFYEGWGFDVPAYTGDKSWELPIPATYVLDQDGTIVYSMVDTDHGKRPEPDSLIEVLPAAKCEEAPRDTRKKGKKSKETHVGCFGRLFGRKTPVAKAEA